MKVYNSYWKQSGNCLILSLMFFSPQIWWLQCNSPHSHAHIFLANRNLSVSTEETQITTTYVKFKPTAKALGMWLNASVLLLWMLSQLLLYLRIEVNLFVIQTKYLCPEYYFKLWQLLVGAKSTNLLWGSNPLCYTLMFPPASLSIGII